MQQPLDTLQQQLEIVKQFEKLFNVANPIKLEEILGRKETEGTFLHFMRSDAENKCKLAFSSPTTTSSASTSDNLSEAIQDLKQFLKLSKPQETGILAKIFETEDPNAATFQILDTPNNRRRNVTFLNEVFSAMRAINKYKNDSNEYKAIQSLVSATKNLIAKQKKAVELAIDSENKSRKEASLDKCSVTLNTAFRAAKTINKYVATSPYREKRKQKGQDLSALEAKKQFRKKCARYTGAAVLATSGTAAIAFSTLMQFGPQFAMLASLNLPPVALAAVAVSGVAMVAAAAYVAYRTCKPAPVVVTASADAPVNTSYMQRLSQHSDCCLKLFKKPTTTSVATAQGNQVGGAPTRMVMDRV